MARPDITIKRIVAVKVLPGQPLDGSGKVCIHLLVRDDNGPITEPYMLHRKKDENGEDIKGRLEAKPTRARLACDRKKSVAPVTKGRITTVTFRTEEPEAVTCPKCKATKEYIALTSPAAPTGT